MTPEEISKLGPGWIKAPLDKFFEEEWEPALSPVLDELWSKGIGFYTQTIDVKVHMLMPGQWPCIPNWHYDMVPRDDEGNQMMSARDRNQVMWLWVSGHPLPEFAWEEEAGRRYHLPAQTWREFTQFDSHRGTMSAIHTWRLFIRVCPRNILPPLSFKREDCIRRHTQVYLDADNFKW